MATKLTPRAKAEATGICQRDGSYCYAWKVHFLQEESGRSQTGERFYAYRADAEADARQAMADQTADDARVFGRLIAEVRLVSTTPECVERSEAARASERRIAA